MAQRMVWDQSGIKAVPLGSSIDFIKDIRPIKNHPKRHTLQLWNAGYYRYYFLLGAEQTWADEAAMESFFLAADSKGIISGIILVFKDSPGTIVKKLNSIYGSGLMGLNAANENPNLQEEYWRTTTGTNIFLTAYPKLNLFKISLHNADLHDLIPGVSLKLK